MKRENYKSDLRVAVQLMLGGENIPVPDHDFMLRFTSVGNYITRKYDCKREGDVWTNCYERDGQIICCLDRHKFMPGRLNVEYYDYAPASDFLDGNYLKVVPRALDIELITGAGDDAEEIDASIVIDITSAIADAKLATNAANQAAENANEAATNANNAAANANVATANANNAADRVGDVISTAEEAISDARTATSDAECATNAADAAARNAQNAADAANDAARTANESADNADAATRSASQATSIANDAAVSANNAAERVEDVLSEFNTDNYYTRTEINQKFSEIISGKSWIIVGELPLRGDSKYIYLISNGGTGNNTYDEYVWLAFAGRYEKIGSTNVNLNDYYTRSQVDGKFNNVGVLRVKATGYSKNLGSSSALTVLGATFAEARAALDAGRVVEMELQGSGTTKFNARLFFAISNYVIAGWFVNADIADGFAPVYVMWSVASCMAIDVPIDSYTKEEADGRYAGKADLLTQNIIYDGQDTDMQDENLNKLIDFYLGKKVKILNVENDHVEMSASEIYSWAIGYGETVLLMENGNIYRLAYCSGQTVAFEYTESETCVMTSIEIDENGDVSQRFSSQLAASHMVHTLTQAEITNSINTICV